jgi:hypothetical protein
MRMGGSGGRSLRNRTSSANRRATQRERDLVDPPGRDEWEKATQSGGEVPNYWKGLRGPGRLVAASLLASVLIGAVVVLAPLLLR